MTDETLDGVFINPGFFGMCNKCFTAVMRVMRRDTEGLNSLIKVASIEFIAGVAIRTISAGKIEWIFIMVGFSMTAAYMALGKTYQEYRRQVAERWGTDAEKDVWKDAQSVTKEPTSDMKTEKLLCYEPISKRYFHATEAELTDAFYTINRSFAVDGEVSLNDFYSCLGLEYLPNGDTTGWSADYLANEWEYYWIDFQYYKQTTDDGLEVYYVDAFQPPIENYIDYDPYAEYCDKKEKQL